MRHSKKDDALEGEILGRDETPLPPKTHWAVYVSLALMVFIGGLFAAPYAERAMVMIGLVDDTAPTDGYSEMIASTQSQIEAQNAKIKSLSDVLAALEKYENAQSDEVKAIVARLRALEVRPVPSGGQISAPSLDLGLAVEPLIARIEALEAHSGHPIGTDLSAVEARLAHLEQRGLQTAVVDEAVVSLKALSVAAEHAETVKRLSADFQPLITEALRADARGVDEGLWANVKGWAKALVVVRPTDDLTGNTLAARLGRAEQALAEGTPEGLEKAAVDITAVAGPARDVVLPWLNKANEALGAMKAPALDEANP